MKHLYLVLVCLITITSTVFAQDQSMKHAREEVMGKVLTHEIDSGRLWKKGGMFGVTFNQGSLTNWAAGGDKLSLSLLGTLNLFSNYKNGKHAWDNTLDVAYGYVNTTSLGSRKNDDRIDFTSKYGYDIGNKIHLTGLFNFRSQFDKGFIYDNNKDPELVSKFMSPAFIVLSPGLDYIPSKEFSLFLSPVTARWVVVLDDTLSSRGAYGVVPGEHVKGEFGAYLSSNWNKDLTPTINLRSKLELFSNYRNNPANIDMFWTTSFNMKIHKWITASLNFDMIYDDDVRVFENSKTGVLGPRLQVKQIIGIGLTTKF